MDKKGSRSVQPLAKGVATDAKKSQDANKLWPRGGRRREPNGGTFPKNETSRKPIPQRNKIIDKRPRPRGFYHSGVAGGKEDAWVETQEAELGSVFVQGSKKQSLNHLLNFHFEPRETRQLGLNISKAGHRWNSSLKHKYNKEQFLQANCQFVVRESGDYKAYMNNPDALVDWDLIEQVNIYVPEFPSCPICLYPPIAAKMTRCGHIYCWSCVLHYLALSDKTWRKCPICYESMHKTDLKSVIAIPHSTFNLNEKISFKLMKRARGSLIAYPTELSIQDNDIPFKVSVPFANDIYSKLLVAGKTEVMSFIDRERMELLRQLAEDENCPEKCFIEQALSLLHDHAASLDICAESFNSDFSSGSKSNNRERCESTSSDNLGNDNFINIDVDAEDLDVSSANNSCKSSKYFYFYQAIDGQHIYMHALNVRMLEHTYGSLEFCPKIITGCIIEKESGSMTEELRKRLRCLQHLPVTCQFEVAEILLKPPLVNKATIEHFAEQIETRRKHRQRRARDERRREKRITEEENKKLGKFAPANIKLESYHQFPTFQSEAIETEPDNEDNNLSEVLSSNEGSLLLANQTENVSISSSLSNENECSSLSFAKMLSSNAQSSWTVRKSTRQESSSSTNVGRASKISESEPDPEGYTPVPAFNQSFGDAIALALEKAVIDSDGTTEEKVKGKKKKNKQKKILFATSMACSSN